MRLKMLDSLSNIGLTASDHWWKKQNLPKTISRYLDLLWREEGAVIKSDPEKHKMFFDLLHRAAQTQEPLAIQLQKTIATP